MYFHRETEEEELFCARRLTLLWRTVVQSFQIMWHRAVAPATSTPTWGSPQLLREVLMASLLDLVPGLRSVSALLNIYTSLQCACAYITTKQGKRLFFEGGKSVKWFWDRATGPQSSYSPGSPAVPREPQVRRHQTARWSMFSEATLFAW